MIIYPAIDIKDGKCVRLKRGNFNETTVFSDEPWHIAEQWRNAGASYIHVVDLDGARRGSSVNNAIIERIVRTVDIPVQVGGGVRNMNDIKEKFEIGVTRVILGTAAVKNPDFVKAAVDKYGDRIVVGIDASNGLVAISGWEEVSEVGALRLCLDMQAMGVSTIVYTDIAKDGMMQGPNVEETKKIIDKCDINIIASGGVSRMSDLQKIHETGAYGVIIGKALYRGALDLADAISTYERV